VSVCESVKERNLPGEIGLLGVSRSSQGILASSDCYQIRSVSQDSLSLPEQREKSEHEPTCRQIPSFLSVSLFDPQEAQQHFSVLSLRFLTC